jgi:drug/metabolite transporter (DMT)-like permease
MKANDIILILTCVVGIAAGQILFKLAAVSMAKGGGDGNLTLLRFFNPYLLTALVLYMVTTLLWVWVLRTVSLNLAYPFMALAFFLVPLLGSFLLGEDFGARHLFGNLLIISGILVIVV